MSGVTLRVTHPTQPPVQERVTEAVIRNTRAALEGVEQTVGSVAGILDVINLRRGAHKISLYDDTSRHSVRCQFSESLFNVMRDALGQRVRALGKVTRNRRGQILTVQIDQIELLPTKPAPTVDDLVGIAPWYTGERSTDEYVRWMRNEEDSTGLFGRRRLPRSHQGPAESR